ncbi:MAG: DUF2058 domain-containing protein [Desulfobacteraceae bacterium]|nr:DUF2058 domain-containing protein [Desulfobacteraceae bacterium]
MGTSFQDQLLKSGLVNKKQVKKAKHQKLTNRKKNQGQKLSPEINKTLQDKLAKEKLNQELNKKLNKEKQRLENLAQVRQFIVTNRLDLDNCDDPYYFAQGKKIKKLFVNEIIAKKLSCGQLGIVKLDDCFEIVPAKVANQIADRDQEALIILHKPEK